MSDARQQCACGLSAKPAAVLLISMLTVGLVATTGCKVRVDKSDDGQNVKIATPFGSIAVNKNQTSAADLGLPAYPGATVKTSSDGNDSANVDMGFGSWKLRVRVAHYTSADDRDQVMAFYRKALSEYGGVIECSGKQPVGTPTRTGEGLTCDDGSSEHSAHGNFNPGDLQLKAGSPRHQHLVVFDKGGSAPTSFSLVALDLPHGDGEQHGTN
jgi:hypothetical protein